MGYQVNGVFKGGGAKGVAYAGAIQACEEFGLEFHSVAGSSAGAITAMLVARGYDARAMSEMLPEAMGCLDGVSRATLHLGRSTLLATNRLERWLDDRLRDAVGRPWSLDEAPVTFAQLHQATSINLCVVAIDLGSRQPVVFSNITSPEMSVVSAVLASSSIPVAFPPVRMALDDRVVRLVGGGVWANYPSFVFLDNEFRAANGLEPFMMADDTVGFVVDDREPTRLDPSALRVAIRGPRISAGSMDGRCG